eukprot:2659194-Pleurochrysis_carterae.AAC.1
MDALMRARDTAARHTLADAQSAPNSDARVNAVRNDVLATAHRKLNSAREALTAIHGELDSAREQLSSSLTAAPTSGTSRTDGDSHTPACLRVRIPPTRPRPCANRVHSQRALCYQSCSTWPPSVLSSRSERSSCGTTVRLDVEIPAASPHSPACRH